MIHERRGIIRVKSDIIELVQAAWILEFVRRDEDGIIFLEEDKHPIFKIKMCVAKVHCCYT